MFIFGPISFACWVYATIFWVLTGREVGYGGYDSYGNKVMGTHGPQLISEEKVNGMKNDMSMNGMNGTMNGTMKNGINGTKAQKVM